MGKTNGLQKPGEITNVSHQPFHLDFFPEIKSRIRTQDFGGTFRGLDDWQESMLKCLVEVKPFSKLCCHKGVKGMQKRSASQQIHACSFKFTRTRSSQYKFPTLFRLYQAVNHHY